VNPRTRTLFAAAALAALWLRLPLRAEEKKPETAVQAPALSEEDKKQLAAATAHEKKAGDLYEQGKNAEAEAEKRAVLAIQERVLGMEHPDVAWNCYYLVSPLVAQKKIKDALSFARRALAIFEKSLGKEHPATKGARWLVTELEKE
jgi:hypothetical protein